MRFGGIWAEGIKRERRWADQSYKFMVQLPSIAFREQRMRIGLIPYAQRSVNLLGIEGDEDEFGDAMSEKQRGDGIR